MLIAKQHL